MTTTIELKRAQKSTLGKNTQYVSILDGENESTQFDNYKERLELQSHARALMPLSRIRICNRYARPDVKSVDIMRSNEGAKFHGLMQCKNVWLCPVCSAKIWAGRGAVLENGLKTAKKLKFHTYLLTFTIGHKLNHRLRDTSRALIKAYRAFFGGRAGQKIKEILGYVGAIRVLEIRYGFTNGFHPHYHVLILTDSALPATIEIKSRGRGAVAESIPLEKYLKTRWATQCERVGRYADSDIGLDISAGHDKLSAYITKQACLHLELTQGDKKKSEKTFSPIQLLQMSLGGDSGARGAWVEYAQDTKGFKALQYSDGLKELLGLDSIEGDSEIERPTSEKYASIPLDVWHMIKTHKEDLRPRILTISANESLYHLAVFLARALNAPFTDILPRIMPNGADSKHASIPRPPAPQKLTLDSDILIQRLRECDIIF